MRFRSLINRGLAIVGLILISISMAGCLPGLPSRAEPTVNPTYVWIMVMLTQTAAAPTPGPTNTPAPEATATLPVVEAQPGSQGRPAAPGQRLSLNGLGITVLNSSLQTTVGDMTPENGQAYLDVEVLIDNSTTSEQSYSPLHFKLFSAADAAKAANELQPMPVTDPLRPRLLTGKLLPGDLVRGHLFFLVPGSSGSYVIGYDQQATPGKPPELWVDLSQAAAGGPLPTANVEVSPKQMGNREVNTGAGLTITQASASRDIGTVKAGEGSLLLVLDVIVENAGREDGFVPYNPEYFKIKDADGYEYPPKLIPLDTMLQAGRLKFREEARGSVVFEIPDRLQQVIAEYEPLVLDQPFKQFRMIVKVPPA